MGVGGWGGWEIFPGAPCVCWLLFQTISTSLIILIRHFYTWIPLFRIFLFLFFPFTGCQLHWRGGRNNTSQILSWTGDLDVYIILTGEKSLRWSRVIQPAKSRLSVCLRSNTTEPRDARPHRYSSRHCQEQPLMKSVMACSPLNSISQGSTTGPQWFPALSKQIPA